MASRGSEAIRHATASAVGALTITKSDVTVLQPMLKALYVGGTGDVAVTMADGTTVTFSAVPVGALLPIQIQQVLSTGTTATLMVGLY